jgi:soluble lytic murein transglycosylase-like protein
MAGAGRSRLESLGLGPLLDRWADRYGVDRALVYGLVAHESGFDPRAYRVEPRIGDASRGLTQILYRTAQGEGYTGPPDGLFDPDTNLRYGVSYLRRMLDRFGALDQALAAYNGGPGIVRADGSYPNRGYVQAVLDEVAYWQQYLGAWGWFPGSRPNPWASPPVEEAGMSWIVALILAGVILGGFRGRRRARRVS